MLAVNGSAMISGEDSTDALSDEVTEAQYETLVCKICLSLMIPPVMLPCKHEMCLQCYQKSMDEVNFLCPFCRLRVSCWSRNASKRNQIINWDKLRVIECNFPHIIHCKQEFESKFDTFLNSRPITRVISSDGEIGKDFQILIDSERELQLNEEKQNELLIKQLIDEDMKMLNEIKNKLMEQTVNDELIARKLQEEEANNRKTDAKRSRDTKDWYEFRARKQVIYTEPPNDVFEDDI